MRCTTPALTIASAFLVKKPWITYTRSFTDERFLLPELCYWPRTPASKGLTGRRPTNNPGFEFIERNDVIHFCNLLLGEAVLALDIYPQGAVTPDE